MFNLKSLTILATNNNSNKKLGLILSVLLLLGITACAPTPTPTQPLVQNDPTPTEIAATPTQSNDEIVELQMAWWGSQDRHDRTIAAIKLYESQNPQVKITYDFADYAEYWTKMDFQATGDNLPDIMQQDYSKLEEWISRDALIPLDEYEKAGVLDFSHVPEVTLSGGRLNNHLYGVDLGTNAQAFLLDVDAFERAGIELPPDDWTWQDFEKITLDLHKKLGIWGMGQTLTHPQLWRSLYLGHGQAIYSEDGTQLGYTDDQIMIDHLKMLMRLQKAGAIPTIQEELALLEGEGRLTISIKRDPIVTQKTAMTNIWSNQIVAYQTNAGETRRFKLVPIPRPEGGQPSIYIKHSQFFSVSSDSKHPKEAALFINWVTNSVEANKILLAERGVPVSTVVQDSLQPLLGKPQLEMFDYLKRVQNDCSPLPKPDPVSAAKVTEIIYYKEFIDPVLLGHITPEEGVALFREFANKALSEPAN